MNLSCFTHYSFACAANVSPSPGFPRHFLSKVIAKALYIKALPGTSQGWGQEYSGIFVISCRFFSRPEEDKQDKRLQPEDADVLASQVRKEGSPRKAVKMMWQGQRYLRPVTV